MSRCYPFPPPGYAGKCSSHEALIKSIKLQKEKEKALSARPGANAVSDREREKFKSSENMKHNEHRKDRKRDREERRKEKIDKEDRKKEKKENRAEKKAKFTAPVDSGKQNVNVVPESKGKLQGSSCELLERSIVTEEHGQPIESQNVPCSSDSTGNSGKRRKTSSSPSGKQSNGNIIRIRLSSSKKDEPSTSGSSKLQAEVGPLQQTREALQKSHSQVRPCGTSVKAESSMKQKDVKVSDVQGLCVASTSCATLLPVSADVSCSKEKTTEAVSEIEKLSSNETIQIREHPIEKLSSHDRKMQKKESVYQNLFVDWVVAPALERILTMDENDDDEDWLFGKKNEDNTSLRASDDVRSSGNNNNNVGCAASAVMQPRACFLPDAEIYALPFTVPF